MGFEEWKARQMKVIGDEPHDPKILEGFRALHEAVHRSNRRYVSSPENLWNHFNADGRLPSINPVVDIYNLVSLESLLALGAHDVDRIEGDVRLGITSGGEHYHPLGAPGPKQVGAGEYAYIDGGNDIICRMEVRQVEKTKISSSTTNCFYIVQWNSRTSQEYVMACSRTESMHRYTPLSGEERRRPVMGAPAR